MDTDGYMFYKTDKKIQYEMGKKLRYISRLCQDRISDLINQLQDEKRRKLMNFLKQNKSKSKTWQENKKKSIKKVKSEIILRVSISNMFGSRANARRLNKLNHDL